MYGCPIDYYKENLVFNTDKSCWAVYKLSGFNYDYLSTQGKINKLARLARVFTGIMSYAQILVIPIEQNIEEHFKGLKKRLKSNDMLYETAVSQVDMVEGYIKQKIELNGSTNDYATYFIVKLKETNEFEELSTLADLARYFIKDPINAINVHMNLDTKDILESKLKLYEKMAQAWLNDNNLKISMKATDTKETQWLFRRMAYRGTGHDVKLFYENQNEKRVGTPEADLLEIEKDKIIKPYKKDTINLFNGNIETVGRKLKITTGFSTSYQAFLPIVWLPDEEEFPGKEWLYKLQKDNLQTEICIHIKAIPHKTALYKLDGKKKEIDSQINHVLMARAEVPEDLNLSNDYADAMLQELKTDRYPLLETSVTICVADKTEEALEAKCSLVKNLYDELGGFVIERPLTDQLKLFMSFIPSVRFLVKDFLLRVTPITLASGMIGVIRELGDRRGGFIGTTGEEEKPVFFSPELACLMNMSPAATLFGDLGVGKSFNANLIIYLMVLYGGYGMILDPKGERGHWETELEPLKGLITTVTLGADKEDKGKLDPYNIYPDNIEEANDQAINVLCDLFAISPKDGEYLAILAAQEKMKIDSSKNSMMKLKRCLESLPENDEFNEVGRRLARTIDLQKNNGMAGLLIGDGTENAITFSNRLTIVQLQNLKMPSPQALKEDYTREEIISVTVFGQMCSFMKKFALLKLNAPKSILVDESWLVSASREGRNMEEFMSRMGRSLFTCVLYNGHSVTDLPTEGIKNSITYKFVFRCSNNENEAKRLLEYIGLEITPENLSVIKNLGAGECLFKDLFGRIGVLKFDPVFKDIMDVFSTTPEEENSIDLNNQDNGEIEEVLEIDRELDFDFNLENDLFAKEEIN